MTTLSILARKSGEDKPTFAARVVSTAARLGSDPTDIVQRAKYAPQSLTVAEKQVLAAQAVLKA